MADEQAHSLLAPSSAARYLNCPGSVGISRGIPDRRSQYADEGQLAHDMAEAILKNKVRFKDIGGTFMGQPVPHDMAENVMLFVKECQHDLLYAGGRNCWTEQRVRLDYLWAEQGKTPPTPMFGKADWMAYFEDYSLLRVRDYKHGKGVFVEIKDNPQLMDYGLGALHFVKERGYPPPEKIEISVTQPRAQGAGGHHTRSELWHTVDLLLWAENVMVPGADRAWNDGGKTLVPGPWCKKTFCPARGTCPALHKMAVETAQDEFGEYRNPSKLTDEQLGQALDQAEVFFHGVQHFVETCRAEASARIDRGHKIPNWKLVPKRATRRWAGDQKTITDWIEKEFGFEEYQTLKASLRSVAEIERMAAGAGQKLMERPGAETYIEKKSSGSTLVPEKDPREKIESGPASDFSKIEETL